MSTPVRIVLVVILTAALFYLVIALARGVSAKEPAIPQISVDEALEMPMDPDAKLNLEADLDTAVPSREILDEPRTGAETKANDALTDALDAEFADPATTGD